MKKGKLWFSGCLVLAVVIITVMCWLSTVGVMALVGSLKGVGA